MSKKNSFKYFKTSPEIIKLAVMYYVRFPLSLRQVEDILHERGINICHETVRYWWNRFGPLFAANIRNQRTQSSSKWQWHLDEVFVKINGELHYLWRAVDHEGEVLEVYVTKWRDKRAALKFWKKSLNKHGHTHKLISDKLASYKAALREIGALESRDTSQYLNNRAENSHLSFRRRERAMNGFRSMKSLQKFTVIHKSFYNHFNLERHLYSRQNFKKNRTAALNEWRQLCAA